MIAIMFTVSTVVQNHAPCCVHILVTDILQLDILHGSSSNASDFYLGSACLNIDRDTDYSGRRFS
jgi:hypothetical protein